MTTPDVTLGELGRRLDSIASDISSIRAEAVMRGEYETRLNAIDREIKELKDENTRRDDKRQPWTASISTAVNVIGLVLTVLLLIFVAR